MADRYQSNSENKIEFLKFEEGSCLPELVQTTAHIAYTVPCSTTALEGQKGNLSGRMRRTPLPLLLLEEEGVAIELMETVKQTKQKGE